MTMPCDDGDAEGTSRMLSRNLRICPFQRVGESVSGQSRPCRECGDECLLIEDLGRECQRGMQRVNVFISFEMGWVMVMV